MSARIGSPHIGLIVEGRGDHGSVPVLLRKYLHEKGEYGDILGTPVNVKGIGNATKDGGLERFVAAVGNRPGCVAVLVILDGEGEPVCQLGPELLGRVTSSCACPVVVALADQSFEDWLFASAETLGLADLEWDENAKGGSRIARAVKPKSYTKPVDQPKLTHRVDLSLARERSHSLNRMLDRFDTLRALIDLKPA